MNYAANVKNNRRKFLQYLATSPVLAMGAKQALAATAAELIDLPNDPYIWKPYDPNYIIEKPEDAIDVFEMEPVAHKNIPPAHWGFMSTGADSELTYIANRKDHAKFAIRSRRLIDVKEVDTSREIFGTKYSVPFFLCPIGRQKTYHPDGELGVAKASGRHNVLQTLATNTNYSTDEAKQARGGSPVMFQLYQQTNWEMTKLLIAKAERSGCKALLITVDGVSARKDTQADRQRRADTRICATCHEVRPNNPKSPIQSSRGLPMFSDVPAAMWDEKVTPDTLTWEYVKRVRDFTKMPMFVKGIMDVEDALKCAKLGYGVYVSNHGGRNEDTGGSSLASFADIAPALKGKVPLFVDGGFRRGMDIVKAIAMGATMVGVGRPYIWGLGAFGEAGVDRVLQILKAEFKAAQQQVGAVTLKDLHPGMIHRAL